MPRPPLTPPPPPSLTPDDAAALPTWRAAYSDRTAAMMAKMSELAYVPFVNEPTPPPKGGSRAERDNGRADLEVCLKAGGFRLVAIFNKQDTQAFLAVNDQQFGVLAFRGTTNLADWLTNLNAIQVPLPGFPGVKVHAGFLQAFECCREDIVCAVNRYVPDDLGLYITGHSLGGGLAQIASAILERNNLAACYTFGSPRVGTLGFDRNVKCPHYRLVNHWDLVPGVPAPTVWGYHHTGDPRLLIGSRPQEALRRDRDIAVRLIVDLWSLLVWPFTGGFFAVNDHMIWNYRRQLAEISVARARPAPERAGAKP